MSKKLIYDENQGVLNASKNITTSIPYNLWLKIKKSKESWNGLIIRGWEARNDFDGLKNRANVTEKDVRDMQDNIARFQKIIFDLNKRIGDMMEVKK